MGACRVSGAVEHTAPLLPGSSGGPIVDGQGRLLGINTNRLGKGFYQAIAADQALRDKVAALGRGESPKRRYLGVGLAPATGALLADLLTGAAPLLDPHPFRVDRPEVLV